MEGLCWGSAVSNKLWMKLAQDSVSLPLTSMKIYDGTQSNHLWGGIRCQAIQRLCYPVNMRDINSTNSKSLLSVKNQCWGQNHACMNMCTHSYIKNTQIHTIGYLCSYMNLIYSIPFLFNYFTLPIPNQVESHFTQVQGFVVVLSYQCLFHLRYFSAEQVRQVSWLVSFAITTNLYQESQGFPGDMITHPW